MPVQMSSREQTAANLLMQMAPGTLQPTPLPLSFQNTLILHEPNYAPPSESLSATFMTKSPTDAFQIFEQIIQLQKSQSFNRRCEKRK